MHPISSEEKHSFVFILGDNTYYVRNEDELAFIFELLGSTNNADALQWNAIMSLDEKLLEIIKTYKGLFQCLKHLSYRNRFLLLIKIGDILSQVLWCSEYLGSILAGIPEEKEKIRLLKSIRQRWLARIIADADDLGNVLEWVYGEAELLVLDMLGQWFLRSLFSSGRDIYKVAHFLSDANKDYFVELLGMEFFRPIVRTADDFFYIIKAITVEKTQEFIRFFSPAEIRALIKSDEIFHSFLKKIAYQKEDALLEYLGYTLTSEWWKS